MLLRRALDAPEDADVFALLRPIVNTMPDNWETHLFKVLKVAETASAHPLHTNSFKKDHCAMTSHTVLFLPQTFDSMTAAELDEMDPDQQAC